MHRYTQIIHAHGAYTIFTYAYTRVSTNSESCFPSLARRLLSLFKKASRSSHERCLRQSLRHERRPKTLPTVATFQESLKQYSSRTRDLSSPLGSPDARQLPKGPGVHRWFAWHLPVRSLLCVQDLLPASRSRTKCRRLRGRRLALSVCRSV
jgi:hypothetical protein